MKFRRLKKGQKLELVRIVEYMVAGGAFFWSGYAMFAVCDQWLGLGLWWSKLIANITGVTVNFILERWWVFKGRGQRKDLTQVTGRYLALTGVNFVIDYYIVYGLTLFGISPYLGQFVSAGFFTVWNYLWYRFWVFAKVPGRQPRKKRA